MAAAELSSRPAGEIGDYQAKSAGTMRVYFHARLYVGETGNESSAASADINKTRHESIGKACIQRFATCRRETYSVS